MTAFSPRAVLGFGVFKLRRVLVRKVPSLQEGDTLGVFIDKKSRLHFRAEKRSAQASAHPLPQAQGGLFCVLTVFVCCWSSE